ncbi:hypothetical protein Hanom_Chr17g01532751 [Helianthus anomalus]
MWIMKTTSSVINGSSSCHHMKKLNLIRSHDHHVQEACHLSDTGTNSDHKNQNYTYK